MEWAVVDGNFKSVEDVRRQVGKDLPLDPPHGFAIPKDKHDHFGLYFRGYLSVPYEGLWRFRLASDDGSRLIVDGHVVIDNDGPHSFKSVEGVAPLTIGVHEVELLYFENEGQEALELEWQGPNLPWARIGEGSFVHSKTNGAPFGARRPAGASGKPAATGPAR